MCEGPSCGLHSLGTAIVLSGPGAQWLRVAETGTQRWAWNLASSLLGRGLALRTPGLLPPPGGPREARGPHGCPFKSVSVRLPRWGCGRGWGDGLLRRHQSPRPSPIPSGRGWRVTSQEGGGSPFYPGPPPAQTSGSTACPCREGRGWRPQGSTAGLCDLRPVHVCLCALAALSLRRKPWLGPSAGGGLLGKDMRVWTLETRSGGQGWVPAPTTPIASFPCPRGV